MSPNSNYKAAAGETTSSTGSVVLAWLVVGIPLAWGVSQTFLKALALFK